MKKRIVSAITVISILLCAFTIQVFAVGEKLAFTREGLDLFVGQSYQLQLKESTENISYITSDNIQQFSFW